MLDDLVSIRVKKLSSGGEIVKRFALSLVAIIGGILAVASSGAYGSKIDSL